MSVKNLALAMKMSRAAFYRRFPGRDNPVVVAARRDVRLVSRSASAGEVADYLTEESERLSRAAHPKRVPKST
jgi:AcrR family transcriptional regulator